MGLLCLSASQVLSIFQGVGSGTRDDIIGEFINEYAYSGGNKRPHINLCRSAAASYPCRRWSIGTRVWDENPKINLWLDSSPSPHVLCFLLEALA
jgi:hypothetical protein